MSKRRIGFIGLGSMGGHMAYSLIKAGNDVMVHDARDAAAKRHLAAGARWASTVAELASHADVVFTSLPGPAEIEAVVFGKAGLLESIRPGMVHFDLSTSSPAMVRRVFEAFRERGATMLDAPVSGGPSGAASGKLALWVSGEKQVFQTHEPLLADIGDEVRYIGEIGAGTIAKLVHNCVGYIINTGIAEVFALGIKAGLDPLDLWEAVREGAIGRRRVFEHLPLQFLSNTYQPAKFALRLAHKDVGLATQLGRELGVPMRMANLALEELTESMNRGWGDWDSKSHMLLELQRANVNIEIAPERLKAAVDRTASKG